MKFSIFCGPYATAYSHGQRTAREVIDWDLQMVKWAEANGFSEAFFAEHYTIGAEPSPAPELMIAAASQLTSRIMLGAAAHLLPYHNPIALAHRMMWLDHMTGGRYIAGVAPGAYPTDAQLFGTGKNNPEMMIEAIDIIEAIWTRKGAFTIEGKYWSVDMPAFDEGVRGPHLRPLQDPHPRLSMTGMQPTSPTLTLAAERGFQPFSQQVSTDALVQHWATYEAAALGAGRTPTRSDWRVMRDFFVADTDQEARDAVVNGATGAFWDEVLLPTFKNLGLMGVVAGDGVDPDSVDVEWLADNFFLIGSPATVCEKVEKLNSELGGFGALCAFTYDYSDDAERYRRSFELMGSEVIPRLSGL